MGIAMAENTPGPMAGKTVLVTGGTGGIGRATAVGLAALGARVGITGRDAARTATAAAAIAAEASTASARTASAAAAGSRASASAATGATRASASATVDAFPADMSSQAEVRRLAAAVLDAYPRLDVLVNNVGGFWATRHATADQLEHTYAVNVLAPFLLTDLLLDRLIASAPARIVTVSSGAQRMGRIDFDDLQGERNYSGQAAYNQSKLADILFTFELARRLKGTGVTANTLHPGLVRTAFAAEDSSPAWKIMIPLLKPFMKSPARGAETSIYLASSPEVEGVSGVYFSGRKPATVNPIARDPSVASRLWAVNSELVGLTHP
jgi:NAD(P)-dependent dehydrogenase (short-subunit alcohol dehydrogenase family)